MIRGLSLLAAMALVACGQEVEPVRNDVGADNAAEQSGEQCTPPNLAMADSAQLASALIDETKANFAAAYGRICEKGSLKARPLIDSAATDQAKLFLVNAPEANVASIYLSSIDGNRMVLEYPFLTTDGRTQVPSAAELEEAIHCAVVGATPEEQESTGRCLVD